jgi:hypothetical protein
MAMAEYSNSDEKRLSTSAALAVSDYLNMCTTATRPETRMDHLEIGYGELVIDVLPYVRDTCKLDSERKAIIRFSYKQQEHKYVRKRPDCESDECY